ncbi:MAG TPA: trimeric intracellular cation channel family protein [Polyangiaceae bacterium]|jgi:uncharacterized membrane protein YeiH
MHPASLLIQALDLVGTFVFAVSGAMVGVHRRMDLFGVLVLAFVTAVFGGITRDVLIGAVPPAAIADWHALAISVAAGLLAFGFARRLERLKEPVQVFDAAGLGVFAVAGTQKALDHGIGWPMAVVLGMLSGIGGGIVRDVLTARTPTVLLADIYAVAALAGGLVVVAGERLGVPSIASAVVGAALCMGLRLVALHRGWRLPIASPPT